MLVGNSETMKITKTVGGIWKKNDRWFMSLDGKPYNIYENKFKAKKEHPDFNVTITEEVKE